MAFSILPPEPGTISAYYESYRSSLIENDLLKGLIAQSELTKQFIATLNEKQGDIKYQPGKWSIKEVIGHICDTERILSYRLLCFIRKETQGLPGFDENEFAANANYSSRTLKDIGEELNVVRQATIHLISNMDPSYIDNAGVASNNPVTVRALIYFILVHERHHINFIKKTYLGL